MESVLIQFLYTVTFFGGRRGALSGKRRTLAFGVLPLPHLRTHLYMTAIMTTTTMTRLPPLKTTTTTNELRSREKED